MFIYDVNKPLNGRITSAVAVAAIMAATRAESPAAQHLLRSALSLSQCFMAAGNGLWPHTHTRTPLTDWVGALSLSCVLVWERAAVSVSSICGGNEREEGIGWWWVVGPMGQFMEKVSWGLGPISPAPFSAAKCGLPNLTHHFTHLLRSPALA